MRATAVDVDGGDDARFLFAQRVFDVVTNSRRCRQEDGPDLEIKNTATHVAKVSIDPMEKEETYFHDVAIQKHAQRFAGEFN